MQGFNWLHLTDLHKGMKDQSWLWPNVKERFFEDLDRLHTSCGPWDLVIFTGDLTQRGKKEEFEELDEFLGELWKHFKKLGSNPKLLAVPGNHDLTRPDIKDPAVKLLQQWHTDSDIKSEFWEDKNSAYRQVISKAFENFTAWWAKQPFKVQNMEEGVLPGDFSVSFEKNRAKLGIIGLNTSFLQLTGKDYKGKLALHPRQFHQACNGDGPAWAKQHQACLLMTHHPASWLDDVSRQYLKGEIIDHGRFAVHLCGHLHEVAYNELSEAGTQTQRTWQGHSLFGLEYYTKESRKIERIHGYVAGEIKLKENKGELIFWPREARLRGNQRDIVPDHSVVLTEQNHTTPVEFELLQTYEDPIYQNQGENHNLYDSVAKADLDDIAYQSHDVKPESQSRQPILASADIDKILDFGIPKNILEIWKKKKKIKSLNDLQITAINNHGLLNGNHLFVIAPTSSGKTMVAEMAAIKNFLKNRKSVFLFPMKALVNDKYEEFNEQYQEYGIRIVRATGETRSDEVGTILKGEYDIALLTYEKFAFILLTNPEILAGVGLLVIDEVQMLSDRQRGANLEFLLTLIRSKRDERIEPQLVILSATIGETHSFENWLEASLLRWEKRPVPLQEGLITGNGTYRYINANDSEVNTKCENNYIFPLIDKDSDQVITKPLVKKLVVEQGEKVIIFRPTKAETVATAKYLANFLNLNPAFSAIESLPIGDNFVALDALKFCLSKGVAFHNAELDPESRIIIEETFRDPDSPLRIVVATTTLAMGINTPADSVIISGLEHPKTRVSPATPYSVGEYRNMAGRAGRKNFTEVGKCFLIARNLAKQDKYWHNYVIAKPEIITSQFRTSDLLSIITRILATRVTEKYGGLYFEDIKTFLDNSFAAYKANPDQISWSGLEIESALAKLQEYKLLELKNQIYSLTELGKISGQEGIEVSSIVRLIQVLQGIPPDSLSEFDLICIAQITLELDDQPFPTNVKQRSRKSSFNPHKEIDRWKIELEKLNINEKVRLSLMRLGNGLSEYRVTERRKRAVATIMWYQGYELSEIETHLMQHHRGANAAGPIRAAASRTQDLMSATTQVADLICNNTKKFSSRIDEILLRLELGIPKIIIPLAQKCEDSLSRGDYLLLINNNLASASAIASSNEDELMNILKKESKVELLKQITKQSSS